MRSANVDEGHIVEYFATTWNWGSCWCCWGEESMWILRVGLMECVYRYLVNQIMDLLLVAELWMEQSNSMDNTELFVEMRYLDGISSDKAVGTVLNDEFVIIEEIERWCQDCEGGRGVWYCNQWLQCMCCLFYLIWCVYWSILFLGVQRGRSYWIAWKEDGAAKVLMCNGFI